METTVFKGTAHISSEVTVPTIYNTYMLNNGSIGVAIYLPDVPDADFTVEKGDGWTPDMITIFGDWKISDDISQKRIDRIEKMVGNVNCRERLVPFTLP